MERRTGPGAVGALAVMALVTTLGVQSAPPTGSASPTPPPGQPPSQRFATGTTAVLVDVVVRDSRGAPIVDLKPADFELFEDDVEQEMASVELVSAETGGAAVSIAGASPSGATTSASFRPKSIVQGPTVVALVFHRLSPEGRALAHRAALTYLENGARDSDFAGVFMIDQGLATIQTYTSNQRKLKAAIDDAAGRLSSVNNRQAMGTAGNATGDASANVSPTAGAESAGRPVGDTGVLGRDPGAIGGDQAVQVVADRMEHSFSEMMRDRDGHAETAALTALVGSLSLLPGRKTVVFFSEGLSVTTAVEAKFRAIIDTANKANVSVYALDAAGLRVHSSQAATARAIGTQLGMIEGGDTGGLQQAERGSSALWQDPQANLGMLAKDTGGFLINNTNALPEAFRRVDADRRFHYLLTYAPKNPTYDGKFRRIAVKVARRDAEVRARSGYVASRSLGAIPMLVFESAAVAALARTPRPTDLAIEPRVFRFPVPGQPTRLALMVSVAPGQLTYTIDPATSTYTAEFAILARLVDRNGEALRKGTQPYKLTGPALEAERARQGEILFYRQPELPAGDYTLEYAVHDALSNKAGTGARPLSIPDVPAGKLALSDLVIVQRAEQVPERQRDPNNPLFVGELLLYPNLGAPIRRATSATLTFFYTAHAGGRPLSGLLEVLRGEQAIAKVPLTAPAADATGRVQHVARLPLTSLPDGAYALRLTVNDGVSEESRRAEFQIVP